MTPSSIGRPMARARLRRAERLGADGSETSGGASVRTGLASPSVWADKLTRSGPPPHGWPDSFEVHGRAMPLDHCEHRVDQRLGQKVRDQAEVEKPGVGGAVVVRLGL